MTANEIGFALLILGFALLIGKIMRVKFRWIQAIFLPSSIVAGALLLLAGPQVLGRFDGPWGANGLLTENMYATWKELPGLLISVIFATMFLGQKLPKMRKAAKLVGPQLTLGIALGSGQYVVGLLLAVLFISGMPMMGALIEMAFEGGHGTAAGMRDVMERLGFAEGGDLAVGLATVGIVTGIVVGVALINWGVRTGKTELVKGTAKMSIEEQKGLFREDEHYEAGRMTSRPASVEPFSLHLAIVFVSILVGWLILEGLKWIEDHTYGQTVIDSTGGEATQLQIFAYVPLFPMALLGGVLVQTIANRFRAGRIIDHQIMLRIQGLALDFLIVSAIATLSLEAIGRNIGPFLLLAVGGITITVFLFLFFAPRVIGRYWFERGLGDFGQATGVTATGLILMRIVDPDAKSPAFEAFGYKQLIFEPFFGGGLVTSLAIPVIYLWGPWRLLIVMASLFIATVSFGLIYYRPRALKERADWAAQQAAESSDASA
ncbi:MAG: sodium/glutamate symporter [Actinomycetaceae bacterium]|nr:sodium/glutamate symporter [Actinomycetaceae bacterium]